MLKILSHEGKCNISAVGEAGELYADTITAVRGVWNALRESDKEIADTFAESMSDVFKRGAVFVDNPREILDSEAAEGAKAAKATGACSAEGGKAN